MGNSKSTRCAETVSLGMPQRERELHLAVMANEPLYLSYLYMVERNSCQ
jgi:hypothetical protein